MARSILSLLMDITLCGVFTFVVGGFIILALVDPSSEFDPNPQMRSLINRQRQIRAAGLAGVEGTGDEQLAWPRQFHPLISPSPSGPPPAAIIYNTRNCVCEDDWKSKIGSGASVCTCDNRKCPPEVNPKFLTDAEGQDVCSLRKHTGYGCTVGCIDGKVYWYGFSCGHDGERPCPDLVVTPSPTPSATPTTPPPIYPPTVTWDPKAVVDLRGVRCEMSSDGKSEVCFNEDTQGRTMCPSYVTSDYLRNPRTDGPHPVAGEIAKICGDPSYAEQFYCSVFCQDGNDHVQWWTHDVNWCYSKEGKGACPSRHPVVPKEQFAVGPWSEVKKSDDNDGCRAAAASGLHPTEPVPGLTIGMLTHEPIAFAKSLVTYEKYGLFPMVSEFLIYMNSRTPSLEAVLQPYKDKYPDVIKVLGDGGNVGIAHGITYLTGNATNPYFMLLERDFWLVEPDTCVDEQLRAGIELIKTGAVHVVRYRHQKYAGRPNWAENFFLGHEDDAFGPRQPNLACNIHYWIDDVSKRWPDKFWTCAADPWMVCSDSFYCNWTNNPQLWSIEWWNKEYVEQFDKFKRNDPWWDLESYMNWEPNSWNDRGWTVAQGVGLFKHVDPTKF